MTDFPLGFDNPQPVITDELGTIYRAWETAASRDVAVRILGLTLAGRPGRRQLRSSCLAATDLAGHPGVLALYAVDFTPDNHPYLVTELPHGSMAHRLAVHGPAPVSYTAMVGVALAQTMMAAHSRGVLHQDVRPENVVHTESAGPLLANFGVTRAVAAVGQAELPTECMVHAARELFGWEAPGPAADVYGLASTLYMMLAGQPAYAAEARLGRAALYQRVLRGGPPPIPRADIPRGLAVLLPDMMAPGPADRPPMSVVAEALAAHAAEAPSAAPALAPRVAASAAGPAGALIGQAPAGLPPAGPLPAGPLPAGPLPAGPLPPQPPAPLPLAPLSAPRNDTNPLLVPLEQHPDAFGAVEPSGPTGTQISDWAGPGTGPIGRPRRDTQPHPAQPPAKRRHTGLILLLSAGLVALLAGVAWGAVTAPRSQQGTAAPKITNTSAASPLPPAQQAAYRATGVTVKALARGARVSWTAPHSSKSVAAFIVVAALANQAKQEHTVGTHSRSVVFAGLQAGQRYCFVVGTLVEGAAGRSNTAATSPVCSVVPTSAPASS